MKRRSRLDPLTAKPALGLTAVPTQAAPQSASLTEAELMEYLRQQITDTSQGIREKLLALAGLLEAAGWCVAGQMDPGPLWLGTNARLDLVHSEGMPGTWQDLWERIGHSREQILWLSEERLCIWAPLSRPAVTRPSARLTQREAEILAMLQSGMAGPQIAVTINRAPRTVEKHIANLYRKMGVSSRLPAILPLPFSSCPHEPLP